MEVLFISKRKPLTVNQMEGVYFKE